MSMINYKITLSSGSVMDASAGINAQVLPMVAQAVRAIGQQAQSDWMKSVHGAKLWSGEKDAYAGSIKIRQTGDFSLVVESDYKYADEIENGRPSRDLKKMLDTSMKVRLTEKGKRFLVIPMRHNSSGNNAHAQGVPGHVQGLANAMVPTRVVKQTQRPSGERTSLSPTTGMHATAKQSQFLSNPATRGQSMVGKNNYAWGGRLTAGMLKGAGASAAEVKRYAGMVKMDTSTPGGAKSSSMMTFRIMMEGSKGWIVPAKPGLYLARKVAQDLEPKATAAFAMAIQKSLKAP